MHPFLPDVNGSDPSGHRSLQAVLLSSKNQARECALADREPESNGAASSQVFGIFPFPLLSPISSYSPNQRDGIPFKRMETQLPHLLEVNRD